MIINIQTSITLLLNTVLYFKTNDKYITNSKKKIASQTLCVFSGETHWFVGNEILPNRNFPLIFDSVIGQCQQEIGETSQYNQAEVHRVVEWIQKLLTTKCNGREIYKCDIGVVSPYKKQCNFIRDELKKERLDGITVGSAETFQGQERKIMIISTVRTDNQLGFVSNTKVG